MKEKMKKKKISIDRVSRKKPPVGRIPFLANYIHSGEKKKMTIKEQHYCLTRDRAVQSSVQYGPSKPNKIVLHF